MMNTFQSIELIVCLVSITLHVVWLYLLYKSSIPNRSQRILLINLSLSETCFMVCEVLKIAFKRYANIHHFVSIVQLTGFDSMYYFVMIYLTADRFFEMYLNLVYSLYWNGKRAQNLLVLWVISAGLATVAFLLNYFELQKYVRLCYVVICPIMEVIFLVVAIVTYGYIIRTSWHLYRKNRKVLASCSSTTTTDCFTTSTGLSSADANHRGGKKQPSRRSFQRKLLLPSLLILTFVFFMFIPDVVLMFRYIRDLHGPSLDEWMSVVFTIYFLAFTADAVIYIFLFPVRRLFLNIFLKKNWSKQIFFINYVFWPILRVCPHDGTFVHDFRSVTRCLPITRWMFAITKSRR